MKHILSILAVVLLAGCSLPNSRVDVAAPPFLSFASASLSSIDVGRLPAAVDTTIMVTASAQGGPVAAVTAVFTSADGDLGEYALLDNGAPPDEHANDGIYTGTIPVHLTPAAVGTYAIKIRAAGDDGLISNLRQLPVTILSSNNRPPIISGLIAPDTVLIPTGDTPNYIKVSVAVADSDGLASLAHVSFTSYRPNGTIVGTFDLFDDGGAAVVAFGITSGDDIAGDGRYTLRIPVTNTTDPNSLYRDFEFSATDKSGAISNTLTKRIYIK